MSWLKGKSPKTHLADKSVAFLLSNREVPSSLDWTLEILAQSFVVFFSPHREMNNIQNLATTASFQGLF
jgi:hypothetical protein